MDNYIIYLTKSDLEREILMNGKKNKTTLIFKPDANSDYFIFFQAEYSGYGCDDGGVCGES